MSAWQPIESAPKDRMVLVYCPWVHQVCPGTLFSGRSRTKAGWKITFSITAEYRIVGEPTHWMPLPEPPVSA